MMRGRTRDAFSLSTTCLRFNDGMLNDLGKFVMQGLQRRVMMKDVIHGCE
jgi:hypothetical protein